MSKQELNPERIKYRADIDGLRALAVLSVVGYHAFPSLFRGGFSGVDVFFVISGFLISTIIFENLRHGTFAFRTFYQRRILRIFPALIVVMLATYAFGWFALLGDEFLLLGKHSVAGAGFASNFILWAEAGYFDISAETKPLLHLWSLAIEEQFYIFWPVIIFMAWKANLPFGPILGLLLGLSFLLNVTGIKADPVATFFSPQTRAWELLCGGMLAWLTLSAGHQPWSWRALVWGAIMRARIKAALSIGGIALLILSFFALDDSLRFPGLWALVPVLGAVAIIAAGPNAFFNRLVLSHPIMVSLGLISYPLYLWHWPLLSFARIIEGEVPHVLTRIALIGVSVFLAWLTFYTVERQFRLGSNRTVKAWGLIAGMTGVALLGAYTWQNDGLTNRAAALNYLNNKQELLRTPAIDPQCLTFVGLEIPLFNYCRFNDAGFAKTIAVIGDSHAHVAYPGIAELAKSRGLSTLLIANSSCPPFTGSPNGSGESERQACQKKIDQILDVLRRSAEIETVVMFTRGMLYLTGTEPVTADKDVMQGATLTPAQFGIGFQRTIDQLKNSGKTVFYVTENPELVRTPEACIPRPFRSNPKNCEMATSAVLERQKIYREIVFKLENLKIIDVVPIFCPITKCLVIDDGALLYADADHLSIAGSRFQAQALISTIFK